MMPTPPVFRMKAARLLAATMLLTAGAAMAQAPDFYQGRNEWNPLDSEVQQLPPYCQADLRPGSVQAAGVSAYQPQCGWMNHLCPALVAINRAMNPLLPMPRRKFNLQLADGHLAYTRRHMTANCVLAPEVQLAETRSKMLRGFVK